ncbi:hypothetical protein EK904_001893 [Melospiza melodia maxima]|nr:hypothetical protein EK904_001893 [Melospiza melodia maxima]
MTGSDRKRESKACSPHEAMFNAMRLFWSLARFVAHSRAQYRHSIGISKSAKMVLKKKKEIQVDAFFLDHHQLEKLQKFSKAEEQNLASLLVHCAELRNGIQQIQSIKQIMPLLKQMDQSSAGDPMVKACLDVLGETYFSLGAKNPLKKVLASSLNGLPGHVMVPAVQSFVCCLREELKTTDVYLYRKVLDNLASCMEDFSLGRACIKNLKNHGNRIVQTQLMHDLLIAIKVSMMLIQKLQENIQGSLWKDSESSVWQSMCSLLKSCTNFLMDAMLLQTVQTTSGLAVVLFTRAMYEPVEELPSLISGLLLGTVEHSGVPAWFLRSCGVLCAPQLPGSVLLFLCHGALAMLDWKNGSMGENGEKLLLDIASVLLSLSSELKEPSVATSLSRILVIWTNSALAALVSGSPDLKLKLNGSSDIIGKLLEYIYTHWDHPLDAIRHQTKLIFKHLLQIHQTTIAGSNGKSDPFFARLIKHLLSLDWHVKGKYASLGSMVECVGTENILQLDRTIPVQILDVMSDQSLAPYASDLLETMFTNHKAHFTLSFQKGTWIDQWHNIWVSPLLVILCEGNHDQTTYIIDYYLPKLLKCNPDSLSYMIRILQASADANLGSCSTRGALGALMACLRTARAHGHLELSNIMSSGLVSTECIKQGLVHQHSQVCIDALGLLCETRRTTEIVSLEEMQLIQFFMLYNLNNQSPSVRQQIISLLRKLFCRIQESSQVLYKLEQNKTKQELVEKSTKMPPLRTLQQYKDFMSSVCARLFEVLFPGSSHPTRFCALSILESIAEIFSVPKGQAQVFQLDQEMDSARVQTLIQCFASTFEEVKILAFRLLMKLRDVALNLQGSENLDLLFQAAIDLSTSTKPYDCVTASYLLNFLVYHKGLQHICLGKRLEHNSQLDESTSVSTVEKNTLAVIKLLLVEVEEEIFQAKKSLLQAAASFPMYGRVHCINGALQQLPFNDLTLVSEWKEIVTRLILMSYRLSAVVSPVVQSSSPEGLIPMDSDPESADRLQMILHEIQPQDTNDYFMQAKILKEHCKEESEKLADQRPMKNTCMEMRGKDKQACDVTAQMVLVCCWRSMKEVSLLLGTLCKLLPSQTTSEPSEGLITVEQVKNIGDYFKHHLLQSRHRGAFELAYAGFVQLTEMLSRCNSESLHKMPEHWLSSVLEEIKSCDPSSTLCATRRSAGIPFYIQALLASEPKKGKTNLLKMAMKELISLAAPLNESLSVIPQVHALNILRALYRDTRLGENIMPYVADGIKASVLGFMSPVWAVRNSSTLLFSALITRIFGVKREKDENSKKNRYKFAKHVTLANSNLKMLLALWIYLNQDVRGTSSCAYIMLSRGVECCWEVLLPVALPKARGSHGHKTDLLLLRAKRKGLLHKDPSVFFGLFLELFQQMKHIHALLSVTEVSALGGMRAPQVGMRWAVFGKREVCVSVVWRHEVSPLLHSSLQPHPWVQLCLGKIKLELFSGFSLSEKDCIKTSNAAARSVFCTDTSWCALEKIPPFSEPFTAQVFVLVPSDTYVAVPPASWLAWLSLSIDVNDFKLWKGETYLFNYNKRKTIWMLTGYKGALHDCPLLSLFLLQVECSAVVAHASDAFLLAPSVSLFAACSFRGTSVVLVNAFKVLFPYLITQRVLHCGLPQNYMAILPSEAALKFSFAFTKNSPQAILFEILDCEIVLLRVAKRKKENTIIESVVERTVEDDL